MKEENTKRGFWKLAKVEQLLQGKDGQVRGAKIREKTKGKPSYSTFVSFGTEKCE